MKIPAFAPLMVAAACVAGPEEPAVPGEIPEAENFCLTAQRVISRTDVPVDLILHEEFNSFVTSKTRIDGPRGPQIQQFNWFDDDGALLGISCKLKSADHLNLAFGPDSAGPDGSCQDMNRAVFQLLSHRVTEAAYASVEFDSKEDIYNVANPPMTGPDWLAPFALSSAKAGTLTIHTKGFLVDFTDPVHADRPEPFRGLHYCHLVAPEHFEALLRGVAEPGAVVGRIWEN